MTIYEKFYRLLCHFLMALASTSLLPAIYLIKIGCKVFNTGYLALNKILDLVLFLGVPTILSLCSLWWMKSQSKDSITHGLQ